MGTGGVPAPRKEKIMRIQYWGTAAAEAYPAMFCTCEACRRAREQGGKNIRTRTSALIDQSVMIDFSPDTNYNRLRYGYDMSRLQALCITHAHSDHLSAAELVMHAPYPYCRGNGGTLRFFCGEDGEKQIQEHSASDGFDPALQVTIWKPYQKERVTDTLDVTPLPAKHDPTHACYILLLESQGKGFLYGHDTAFPEEDVFEFLKGRRLDGISLDCNNGARPSGRTHMGLEDAARFAARLEESGCLRKGAVRVINHFSHACGLLHGELEQCAAPRGFSVAWDGMEIDV